MEKLIRIKLKAAKTLSGFHFFRCQVGDVVALLGSFARTIRRNETWELLSLEGFGIVEDDCNARLVRSRILSSRLRHFVVSFGAKETSH